MGSKKRPRTPRTQECSWRKFIGLQQTFRMMRLKINRNMHRWHRLDEMWNLPEYPCCYVIYINGMASYVGETSNIKIRWRAHNSTAAKRARFEGKTVYLKIKIPRRFGEQYMLEKRLIKKMQPPLNIRGCLK